MDIKLEEKPQNVIINPQECFEGLMPSLQVSSFDVYFTTRYKNALSFLCGIFTLYVFTNVTYFNLLLC